MRILFRLVAMFALAFAVVLAVIDLTRIIANSEWTFTPLLQTWRELAPESLIEMREALERQASFLWDPVVLSVLSLPGWLLFGLLSFTFYALSHRRRRAAARYAVTYR